MESVGIICEYNPFHNGHLYHLNKVKEMFPNSVIILVLGGNFLQRGEPSIINKWDKADIALQNGIDLIIELPFPFACQSADLFSKGSISILNQLKANYLVFGSESNDIEMLKELANIQLTNIEYDILVKKYLSDGINYPSALSKALSTITNKTITLPNDILGISYVREIIKLNSPIIPLTIKRTNEYHSLNTDTNIISASSIRNLIKNKENINIYVPKCTLNKLSNISSDDYFPYLKYKIMSEIDTLNIYQTVDEGIENRIKKHIVNSNSLDDLIMKIKTKRYTYNKINRMFCHILCNFTKEEANKYKEITYLRVLGFSKKGQKYLSFIKKNIDVDVVTNYSKSNDDMLKLEFRITSIYSSILNEKDKTNLIKSEFNKPIIR